MKRLLLLFLIFILSFKLSDAGWFKKKKKDAKPANTSLSAKKKISDIITKEAISTKGLFTTHFLKSKLYYEIPKQCLDKELLVVSRIAQTPGLGYGGENINNEVVRWEKKYDKILLRSVSHYNVANDTMPIYTAVKNSNFEPVIKSFDILAYSSDSANILIEATGLYLEDVAPFSLPDNIKKSLEIKGIDKSRCFLDHIIAYPQNVEIKALLTYIAGKPNQLSSTQTVSLMIYHSMIQLPEIPMKPRYYDNRIGYFAVSQNHYGDEHRVENKKYITKWRLEPKPEDLAKFKKGELVEPMKPIIYYIDPATPVKWRDAMKKGVESWQFAFEKAGFKNAILAKDPPSKEEDPYWNPEDARYSVIRYFASPIQNAYGPQVNDPRTGEILVSDIGWYHNVMNLLRNWYFIQASACDTSAQKLPLSDNLMCKLIEYVCAHEVGHTLGLRHNMKASTFFPTDSLRSSTFTHKYGTTPSIMDYARFNYVAQPGDNAYLFPKIGIYDEFAIMWGYKPLPDAKNADEEKLVLNDWLKEQDKNPMLRFGSEGRSIDAFAQTEDLGDDAIKSTTYGVKNLERIMGYLEKATEKEGENYDLLEEVYYGVLNQWRMEMNHVANYVGAMDIIEKRCGQDGKVFNMIPACKQKEAINYISENAFKTPKFLLNESIIRKFEANGTFERIGRIQSGLLNNMLSDEKMKRIAENEIFEPNGYKLSEVYNDIYLAVWKELKDKDIEISTEKRNLQREYLKILESKLHNQNDIKAIAKHQLKILKNKIETVVGKTNDIYTKAHLEDMNNELQRILFNYDFSVNK